MLSLLARKIKIAVHSGSFHPDDVFAVAILSLYIKKPIQVIRTRDPKVWAECDYVCDVGGEYSPEKNIFDHHQAGYNEKRENGIAYSSAGLVWKQFGEKIAGTEVVKIIDEKIIEPIDADDNGISIYTPIFEDVRPYSFGDFIFSFNLLFSEKNKNSLDAFLAAVEEAKKLLIREIQRAKDKIENIKIIEDIYQKTDDKRIIVLDDNYPGMSILADYPEPLFVVKPDIENKTWNVKTIKKEGTQFESRKDLPRAWAGKIGQELADITGVSDVLFCHNKLFIAAAKTKEGAIALAKMALDKN